VIALHIHKSFCLKFSQFLGTKTCTVRSINSQVKKTVLFQLPRVFCKRAFLRHSEQQRAKLPTRILLTVFTQSICVSLDLRHTKLSVSKSSGACACRSTARLWMLYQNSSRLPRTVRTISLKALQTVTTTTAAARQDHGFQSLSRPSSEYVPMRFWCGWWTIPITSFSWTCSTSTHRVHNQHWRSSLGLLQQATVNYYIMAHFRAKLGQDWSQAICLSLHLRHAELQDLQYEHVSHDDCK